MARIQGLLHLRKHEYHRYLGLLKLKELAEAGEKIPNEMRKKLLVPKDLSEEQKYKRRLQTFTMTYKNKAKRKLWQRLQHENNKLGKRFDHSVRLSDSRMEEIRAKALEKTERRMKRDEIRRDQIQAKEDAIEELIKQQQSA